MTKIELETMNDREVLVEIAQLVNQMVDQLKTLNGRTRSLEDWRNVIVGGLGVILFFLAIFAGPYLVRFLSSNL